MTGIKEWFEPLLWILGTLTAIIAFIRLCKPVWKIFTAQKEFSEKMDLLDKKLDSRFEKIDNQFESIENRLNEQSDNLGYLAEQNKREDSITLSLLHDSIVQIYQEAKEKGFISEVSYYRACELYKQNGNSQYIDSVMAALTEIHGKGLAIND